MQGRSTGLGDATIDLGGPTLERGCARRRTLSRGRPKSSAGRLPHEGGKPNRSLIMFARRRARRTSAPLRGLSAALPIFSVPAHSFVDLLAIAPIFRRKLHDRVVDISIDHQHALVRFLRPFPPQIKGVLFGHARASRSATRRSRRRAQLLNLSQALLQALKL